MCLFSFSYPKIIGICIANFRSKILIFGKKGISLLHDAQIMFKLGTCTGLPCLCLLVCACEQNNYELELKIILLLGRMVQLIGAFLYWPRKFYYINLTLGSSKIEQKMLKKVQKCPIKLIVYDPVYSLCTISRHSVGPVRVGQNWYMLSGNSFNYYSLL